MAMGLLGLGTAGVLSSLKTVTIGATGVRDFDTATNLAQSWVERVRTDATAWISETTFGNANLLASGSTGNGRRRPPRGTMRFVAPAPSVPSP